MKYLNCIEATFQDAPWIDHDYFKVSIKNCIPRPIKNPEDRKALERPKTGWNFSVSIFKDYKGETDRLVYECFEFDWKCIKMPKISNSTEDEFRESCLMIYPFLRQIYRRLSASGVTDIILAVGWNEFRNLMVNTLKVTDKNFRPDEVDRLFIAVNTNNNPAVKTEFNSAKGIIRYEFSEVIIRAALKRFIEFGSLKSEAEAVTQFFQ
jgi:hypothetical protein